MRALSWVIVIGACLLVAAALGYYKYDQISDAQARVAAFPEPRETVETFVALESSREPTLVVTGEVVPPQSAQLRTELPGRISRVGFAPGANIAQGDLLVQLDISQEQASLREVRAQEDIARLAYERAERLVKRGAGSVDARDQAKAQFDAAAARAQALVAAIAKKTIVAPFDAVAGLHQLEVGQYLSAGDVIVDVVGTTDALWVDFAVPQENVGLEVGTEVTIRAEAFESVAIITARDSAVSESSRSLRMRAELIDAEHTLLPGMFVQVTVPLGFEESVVLVPATSVRRDAMGASVYVLTEVAPDEVRAQKRPVDILNDGDLSDDSDLVVVRAGLSPGERVAGNGAFKLRDGLLVNPIALDPDVQSRLVGR